MDMNRYSDRAPGSGPSESASVGGSIGQINRARLA